MSTQPSKAYSPQAVEAGVYRMWLDAGAFHAVPDDPTRPQPFSVVIPPPNVTGALHLGHAINNTLQDILVRRARMKGLNTLWMPGVDHAGIATQAVVEKQVFEKEKKTRHDLGREDLVRRIWAWKEQYGGRIVEQLKLMGCSCDWERQRFTLDEVCARAVREWFFRLFRDGLIFRGKRLVNWDTHLQTAVADDEVYHETVTGYLWHIRYPLAPRGTLADSDPGASGRDHLVVATTRPETMLADTAVAVHPEDERYRHLIGRHVVLPLTGRTIPIIADGMLVKREFGTGCVKVTPGHDPNDYACYLRHPEIGIRNMMTPDGRVSDDNAGEGGKYAGLKLEAARKAVVADLEAAGLIEKIEDYETDVGHSDRSKTPIQPYLSDQWFVKMGDLTAEEAARIQSPHMRSMIESAFRQSEGLDQSRDHDGAGVSPSQSRDHDGAGVSPSQSRDRKGAGSPSAEAASPSRTPLPHGRGSDKHCGFDEVQGGPVAGAATDLLPGLAQMALDAVCDVDAHYEGPHAAAARRACDKVHIFPRRYVHTYRDWLSEKRDWCISRQLWWGHRIPVWHLRPVNSLDADRDEVHREAGAHDGWLRDLEDQGRIAVIKRPAETMDGSAALPTDPGGLFRGRDRDSSDAEHSRAVLAGSAESICVRSPSDSELVARLEQCGYVQDPDVLDTWFSSALWPLSTMGWPGNDPASGRQLPDPSRRFESNSRSDPSFLVGPDSHSNPSRDHKGADTWSSQSRDHKGAVSRRSVRVDAPDAQQTPDVAPDGEANQCAVGSSPLPYGRGSDKAEGRGSDKTEGRGSDKTEGRGSDLADRRGSETSSTPEPNLLNVFYPTAVLSTAREIITLWVARMVIAGLYNVGRVPFRDVVIHPVIQDGQGRPMKKTLGNGVDPVDIIDLYGADALRFTLAGMATETQDIRIPVKKAKLPDGREVNTSEKFEVGRNFCNKLWQAAVGYILPNVEDVRIELRQHGHERWHTSRPPDRLPLFDRWIRTRLNHCIADVDEALDAYQFARAADRVRDFFWTEFCDWYLEESKVRLRSAQGSETNDVKVVMLQALDITLQLLHPFAPFITEAVWQEIGRRVPRHFELVAAAPLPSPPSEGGGRGGSPDDAPPLILAPWPEPFGPFLDDACERDVGGIIQPVMTALRQAKMEINAARSQAGQPAIRTLPRAVIRAAYDVAAVLRANEALILRLASTDAVTIGPDEARPHCVRSHVDASFELYVPLEGLVDVATEVQRLQGELKQKRAALDRANAQLSNENFVQRAAPETVQQARERAAELKRTCDLIERHIADMR